MSTYIIETPFWKLKRDHITIILFSLAEAVLWSTFVYSLIFSLLVICEWDILPFNILNIRTQVLRCTPRAWSGWRSCRCTSALPPTCRCVSPVWLSPFHSAPVLRWSVFFLQRYEELLNLLILCLTFNHNLPILLSWTKASPKTHHWAQNWIVYI